MNQGNLINWAALAAMTIASGLASSARADVSQIYAGEFSIRPAVYHPVAIKGQMRAVTSASGVESIRLTLDEAVLGRSVFDSKEQWLGSIGEGSSMQTTIAFKLEGPTHGWYFVFVAQSPDGGRTLSGTIYKAKARLPEIQLAAQSPIPSAPANWKNLGPATLKAQ